MTTDKDMYEYISKSLLEQNAKSIDYWEDEDGSIEEGSDCRYFSTNPQINKTLHCAVGFTISANVYNEEYEGNGVLNPYVLGMVADSNPNWKLTTRSVSMMNLMQNIHDSVDPIYWNKMLDFYKDSFDQDGNFILFDEYETQSTDYEVIHIEGSHSELETIECLKYDFVRGRFNLDRAKLSSFYS